MWDLEILEVKPLYYPSVVVASPLQLNLFFWRSPDTLIMEFTGSLPAPSVSTCLCIEGERQNTVGSDEEKRNPVNIYWTFSTCSTQRRHEKTTQSSPARLLQSYWSYQTNTWVIITNNRRQSIPNRLSQTSSTELVLWEIQGNDSVPVHRGLLA